MMTTPHEHCLFCEVLQTRSRRILTENAHFFVVEDQYPVNDYHSLIIPKRHLIRFSDLTSEEANSFIDVLRLSQERLRSQHGADGFNIGVNEGASGGQTISHLHIHLIPRYSGDVEDPRGGVRNLKPALVAY
jgi:diadenosine tetraphosphate (Ap4A) HIT family hydrolase